MTLEQSLADFLTHLGLEKNSSIQTVKSYREDLSQALGFLRDHVQKSSIEARDWNTRTLRAFVAWLHNQGYAKSTVARRLAAQLFLPTKREWELIRLPTVLAPLYVPLRLLRLGRRTAFLGDDT